MPPATSVPMSPTISDTRAPWISRLRMSRPWKSVPSGADHFPPSIQNGGSNMSAPCTGMVGSYGARTSAKIATSASPPRMTIAASGAFRAARAIARPRLVARGRTIGWSPNRVAIAVLPREPDSRIDEGVEDVHDQVDADDHEAGHDHHALHEWEVALEDALVEQPADARPREDHLDDDG